jgi:competence protein ComEC
MKVLQFPLARISLFFILGIVIAFYAKPFPNLVFTALFISFLLFCIAFFVAKRNFIQKSYFGLSVYLLSFIVGSTTQIVHTDYFQKNNYIHFCKTPFQVHTLEVTLREKLKSSSFNDRYVALVKRMDDKERSGKILVNIEKSNLKSELEIGSNLQLKCAIYQSNPPKNPNQFDYRNYLANKSILAQIYVEPSDIKVSSYLEKDIWFYTSTLRNRIINNLKKHHFRNQELYVINALILGQQQEISKEVLQDYQYAGAVHVLSVSGLHVGFILLFINFLLSRLPKTKTGNLIRFVTVLISLWSFAILAGLSPSIVRSVTMFTFVAAGMFLKRETNIFHTLLVSMLLILLVSPSFLFDVGFQLSYVSLFFIVWVQPLFSSIWIPKYKFTQYFWDIITVSFAAQIGAFPLSIYYFHQFPGLFFVTNLVILPGLGIIMALGVFVMLLAAFNYVPELPAKALEGSVYILNTIINWIASFEAFIIHDIALSRWMMIALYSMIISAIIWLKQPNFKRLTVALLAIIIFQITCISTHFFNQRQLESIVFQSKKNTIVTERIGENVTLFGNDSILKNSASNQTLNTYLVANFSRIVKKMPLKNVRYFKGNKVLVIDSLGVFPKGISPDVLLITQSPKLNLDRLLVAIKPKLIVADGSNYKSYIELWKATCLKQKIPFHATAEKGFYRME